MHPQRSLRTIWELIQDTFTRWISDDAFQMSAAIAFYAAFSMAPGLNLSDLGLFFDSHSSVRR
jgi:uncharacterized BrkB/YihY/UPF0761 family membrane protein